MLYVVLKALIKSYLTRAKRVEIFNPFKQEETEKQMLRKSNL
jgi:hypothetical protein